MAIRQYVGTAQSWITPDSGTLNRQFSQPPGLLDFDSNSACFADAYPEDQSAMLADIDRVQSALKKGKLKLIRLAPGGLSGIVSDVNEIADKVDKVNYSLDKLRRAALKIAYKKGHYKFLADKISLNQYGKTQGIIRSRILRIISDKIAVYNKFFEPFEKPIAILNSGLDAYNLHAVPTVGNALKLGFDLLDAGFPVFGTLHKGEQIIMEGTNYILSSDYILGPTRVDAFMIKLGNTDFYKWVDKITDTNLPVPDSKDGGSYALGKIGTIPK